MSSALPSSPLHLRRVSFVGKLGGLTKREAIQMVRDHGGVPVDRNQQEVDLVVMGAEQLPLPDDDSLVPTQWRAGIETGQIELIHETELYSRLGLVELEQNIRRLYTPAMLADLLRIPVRNVRRWHRLGLIIPVKIVHRLPYFDFQEVNHARQMASLLAKGVSVARIKKLIVDSAKWLPSGERSLAQLQVIFEGKQLLLRQEEGLVEPGGQRRIDFDSLTNPIDESNDDFRSSTQDQVHEPSHILELPTARLAPLSMQLSEMIELAQSLEDESQLQEAIEWYRVAMARFGPQADLHFQLAELLYREGEIQAARERYYAAIEVDDDFVEARANLGCVLAETGQFELAVAAFRGALARHDDYADVHFHLARTLEDMNEPEQARQHWTRFVELAPSSPWADEARTHL